MMKKYEGILSRSVRRRWRRDVWCAMGRQRSLKPPSPPLPPHQPIPTDPFSNKSSSSSCCCFCSFSQSPKPTRRCWIAGHVRATTIMQNKREAEPCRS
jgi:hypothetical protein